ncbi:hypothetical protein J3Q64DRAFT_1836090 [Phycomyces blakesleeanus]|uniref:Uncharacterized protein n=2 Tax=Phycomyces blakesleeanus TaxID=4837 RepID=A0A162UAX7_PHYB8|nr:hypothetical protein PHYBLDRAFT_168178 [Phycomyces blakesleeanus NRRL 1555(-)]OAD73743.1 hypothetical protein PHYBLDRAFT_168178 [Phycomyces blakesleeanus NRRL 1555(-)]|eukprot:XP_018291783.1 hypothetical protein PHYBLDRAFT_168178 [Phycomyces blakesleeanus NRRL 1555(-)]
MYSDYSYKNDSEFDNIAQNYYRQQLSAYLGRKNAQAAAEQLDAEDTRIRRVNFSTESPIVHIYEQDTGYYDLTGHTPLIESTKLVQISKDDSSEDSLFKCLKERMPLAQAERIMSARNNWLNRYNEQQVVTESTSLDDHLPVILIPTGKLPIKERTKGGRKKQLEKGLKKEFKRKVKLELIKELEKECNKELDDDAKKSLKKKIKKEFNENKAPAKDLIYDTKAEHYTKEIKEIKEVIEIKEEKPVQKGLFSFLNLRCLSSH